MYPFQIVIIQLSGRLPDPTRHCRASSGHDGQSPWAMQNARCPVWIYRSCSYFLSVWATWPYLLPGKRPSWCLPQYSTVRPGYRHDWTPCLLIMILSIIYLSHRTYAHQCTSSFIVFQYPLLYDPSAYWPDRQTGPQHTRGGYRTTPDATTRVYGFSTPM